MAIAPSPVPRERPPALTLSTLHLGSYQTRSPDALPSVPSPSRLSPVYQLGPATSNHPSRDDYAWETRQSAWSSRRGSSGIGFEDPQEIDNCRETAHLPTSGRTLVPRGSRDTSRSPTRPSGPKPPPLPPPGMSLPPLPSISPISFGHLSSPGRSTMDMKLPSPHSFGNQAFPPPQHARLGSSQYPPMPPSARPLGPSLTVQVPSPLTPSSSTDKNVAPPSPTAVVESPGRQHSLVLANAVTPSRTASALTSSMMGTLTPPHDASPKATRQHSPMNPDAHGASTRRALHSHLEAGDGSPRGPDHQSVSRDSQRVSSPSPATKRSLPRPPGGGGTSLAQPSMQSLRSLSTDAPRAPLPRPPSSPAVPRSPAPSATWPLLTTPPKHHVGPNNAQASDSSPQQAKSSNLASTNGLVLPVVGGLADAGPYPSSGPIPKQSGASGTGLAGLGLGRPTPTGPSRTVRPPSGNLPPEPEVCLECMMRDRDLADVVVQGDGVWERGSDIAWDELRWKEDEVLKSLGDGSVMSKSIPSLDHSLDSESGNISTSPPSTGHSLEDTAARQRAAVGRRDHEAKRAQRREMDWRVCRDVGWRGFRWEEGSSGEGLPKGFRGSRGGALSEAGIKAVMTKFPSASQHRYDSLQVYLRHQAALIREVYLEAQRLGHYPEPGDVPVSSSFTHDGQSVVAGPRMSSVAWDAKHTSDLGDHMRGAFHSGPRTTPLSLVRPSPSSPAELASSGLRPQPPPLTRPLTHYYPDHEPNKTAQRSPINGTQPLRFRAGKSLSTPTALDRTPALDDDWLEGSEDIWPPPSAADHNLRPFSFAVRAGAAAKQASSDGHGRRTLWGRWGGSVTSFFGGSQGGSGSMIDMHLGLDEDRRERNAQNQAGNEHPRAISLVSPDRPSFFGRDSRSSISGDRIGRLPRTTSPSQLSKMLPNEPDEDEPVNGSSKGLKGFLKKIKPKANRKGSDRIATPTRSNEDFHDPAAPLAPPPPLSFLVGRGHRNQNRNRSGSSSSALTDNSVSAVGGPNQESDGSRFGFRSVSAPFTGRSSGDNLSPTSSRFAFSGWKRESYSSGRDRIQTGTRPGVSEDEYRRDSGLEILPAGRGLHASPEPSVVAEDYGATPRGTPQSGAPRVTTYPPPTGRPHNKTTSSLSASSFIETPPLVPANAASSFFEQRHQSKMSPNIGRAPVAESAAPNPSPNRFKNLPPLPPANQDDSPDSFAAAFSSQNGFDQSSSQRRTPNAASDNRVFKQSGPLNEHQATRSSFDPYGDLPTPRHGAGSPSPRLAQSMYLQPKTAGSIGSFGRFMGGNGKSQRPESGESSDVAEERSVKGRKGLKGLFGRPARVA